MVRTDCWAGSRAWRLGPMPGSSSTIYWFVKILAPPPIAIAVLADGAELEITGESTSVEGMAWWPVRVDQDDSTVTGYVWSGGHLGG